MAYRQASASSDHAASMVKLKRAELGAEARRRNQEQLARLGGEVRAARHRRRLTQAQLGAVVGLARATVGSIERGQGGGHTVDSWQRLAVALTLNLRIELQRDHLEDPVDAGHVSMQELILRLARRRGISRSFELPLRPAATRHAIDVFVRDDARRRLTVVECANLVTDIGAMARNFDWKVSKAEEVAIAIGGEVPYAVGACLVMRASARNRALVRRYAAVFATQWPGSSAAWVAALTSGGPCPSEPGLVWCDVGETRLFAWRRRWHA